MSIKQLKTDLEEHFRVFERVPLRAALKRRDARACFAWTSVCVVAFVVALLTVPSHTLIRAAPVLLLVVPITFVCALHLSILYAQIRAERLGAGPDNAPVDRPRLEQAWLCGRYHCTPAELPDKARALRLLWEEHLALKRLANNDTMGPRIAAFFQLPDPARFIGVLLGAAAIVATLITLGSSTESIFLALQDWKTIGAAIAIGIVLCTELIMMWIIITGMVREIGPSILEQAGLWPINSRRVYRYVLALHLAAEPLTPPGRKLPGVAKAISLFFVPLSTLWKRVWSGVTGRTGNPSGT